MCESFTEFGMLIEPFREMLGISYKYTRLQIKFVEFSSNTNTHILLNFVYLK